MACALSSFWEAPKPLYFWNQGIKLHLIGGCHFDSGLVTPLSPPAMQQEILKKQHYRNWGRQFIFYENYLAEIKYFLYTEMTEQSLLLKNINIQSQCRYYHNFQMKS